MIMSLSLFSISGIFQIKNLDIAEFIASFLNFILFGISFLVVQNLIKQSIDTILSIISRITLVLALFQVVLYVVFNNDIGFFLFDRLSISTATKVGRFEAVNLLGYIRPVAQYHEPSFLALVANLIFAHRLYFKNKFDFAAIAIIILSLSIVGLVTLILTVWLRSNTMYKLLLLFLFCELVYLYPDFLRLGEITRPGTSGHERIGVMLTTMIEVLNNSLVPIALGNWQTLPNNSLQVIIGYYSVLAIPVLFVLGYAVPLGLWGVLFGILFTNGAIFTFTGGFMLGLIATRR